MKAMLSAAVRGFDRIAWYCSWLAPAGWSAGVLALLFHRMAADPEPVGGHSVWPLIGLTGGSLGLLAHTVLGYHILKSRAFTPDEREALWRRYLVGFGYSQWRQFMQRHGS
jgi:hypothetical protein